MGTKTGRLCMAALTYALWTGLTGLALGSTPPKKLDLNGAVELARRNNPTLQAQRWRITEAEGELRAAQVLLQDNPEISAMAGPQRPEMGDAETTWEIDLEQTLPRPGVRRHRLERANARVSGNKAGYLEARAHLDFAVSQAFHDALAAKERVTIRRQARDLSQRLFHVAQRRLARGAATRLELNTARIARAEAARRLAQAQASQRVARLELLKLLGLPSATELELVGTIPDGSFDPTGEEWVARALSLRPELGVAQHRLDAANAESELAQRLALPRVGVGLSYERELDSDAFRFGFRVPIPVFNQFQGQQQQAAARLERLRSESAAIRREIETDVSQALERYRLASELRRTYDDEVLTALQESLDLLERSFEAGEIGYAELIVVQREVLEGREHLLDLRRDYARARDQLMQSAGMPLTQKPKGEKR